MTEDRLRAATRALRATRRGVSATADATETRILARAETARRQRSRRLHYLLPIAAVLAVSSAWAATQPAVVTATSKAWQHLFASPPSRAAAPATVTAPTSAPPAPATPALVAPAQVPAPAASHQAPRPGGFDSRAQNAPIDVTPSRTASAQRSVSPPRVSEPSRPPSPLELYQQAHQLHFKAHDFAAALPAWDRYLAAGGAGSLSLEARYNRAICLARLGRLEEARAALLPFARGDYGAYRQHEAQRLMNGEPLAP